MEGQMKIASVFAAGLIIGLFAGYYIAGVWGVAPPDILSAVPSLDADAVQIAAYKDVLLRRVELSTPLSDAERAAVARAVLERGEAYGFTAEETALLNRALEQ